jgi:ferrous iron transport protein A
MGQNPFWGHSPMSKFQNSICAAKGGMEIFMDLTNAQLGTVYTVKELRTGDEELNAFLFTLGCYVGEPITVISRRKSGCTVSIKDGRYNIDSQLAEAIVIME